MVAMRLYADLVRSHLQVWRDQINGEPSVDFVDEFNAMIDECDDFMILDSPNYRHVSKWCLSEVKRYCDNPKHEKNGRLIVCLLKEPGEWRTRFDNEEHQFYFSKVNKRRKGI